MASLPGFQDASVLRLYPVPNGIGAVFGVNVASSSPADEATVNVLVASNITPDGNLGTSGLSVVGGAAGRFSSNDGT